MKGTCDKCGAVGHTVSWDHPEYDGDLCESCSDIKRDELHPECSSARLRAKVAALEAENNRLVALDAGTKLILENQRKEVERLRGLLDIYVPDHCYPHNQPCLRCQRDERIRAAQKEGNDV